MHIPQTEFSPSPLIKAGYQSVTSVEAMGTVRP